MPQENSDFWRRARIARDGLASRFLNRPEVSLIDIGYAYEHGQRTDRIALRIHVREQWLKAKPEDRIAFPEEVDGISVVVMPGDYQLDTDAPELDEA